MQAAHADKQLWVPTYPIQALAFTVWLLLAGTMAGGHGASACQKVGCVGACVTARVVWGSVLATQFANSHPAAVVAEAGDHESGSSLVCAGVA